MRKCDINSQTSNDELCSHDVSVDLVLRVPLLPEVHRDVEGEGLQEQHERHPDVVVVARPRLAGGLCREEIINL